MKLAGGLVWMILGSWFVLEVLVQLPFAWCKRLRWADPTGHLLAGWNFFAPKPIMGDVELFYRHAEQTSAGAGSKGGLRRAEWKLVQPNGDRCLHHLVVNPRKRARKTIFRCCNHVITNRKRSNLPLMVPYLLLLDRVTMLCPCNGTVQFRVDVIRKDGSRVRGFVSVPHLVNSRGERACKGSEKGTVGAKAADDSVELQCV